MSVKLGPNMFPVPALSRVGYLGPKHTFSYEMAASAYPQCTHVDFGTFPDAFPKLIAGDLDYIVIPFFNNNGHDVLEAQKEIVKYRGKAFVVDLLGLDVEHTA